MKLKIKRNSMRIILEDEELLKVYREIISMLNEKIGRRQYALFGQMNLIKSGLPEEQFVLSFGIFDSEEIYDISQRIGKRKLKDGELELEVKRILEENDRIYNG